MWISLHLVAGVSKTNNLDGERAHVLHHSSAHLLKLNYALSSSYYIIIICMFIIIIVIIIVIIAIIVIIIIIIFIIIIIIIIDKIDDIDDFLMFWVFCVVSFLMSWPMRGASMESGWVGHLNKKLTSRNTQNIKILNYLTTDTKLKFFMKYYTVCSQLTYKNT